jgi:hypothetical protein
MTIDRAFIESAERSHYLMQLGSYFTELSDGDSVHFAFNNDIRDVWYNQAYGITCAADNAGSLVSSLAKALEDNKRTPCVYLSPATMPAHFGGVLRSAGFKVFEEEAWMFFPLYRDVGTQLPSIQVKEVSNVIDVQAFSAVYRLGLPGPEVEHYIAACLRGWKQATPPLAVKLLVAYIGDEPAGMLSLMRLGRFAGVYAVATLPDYRKRGVCKSLHQYAAVTARTWECDVLFLQTVAKETAEDVFTRIGYETWFTREGYVPLEDADALTHG